MTEVDFIVDLVSGGPIVNESYGRTKEAEARLGWEPSVYWYVGVVDDSFGETVVGEWNPALSLGGKGSALPFDSGAFAVDPPKVSVEPLDQVRYVHDNAIGLQTWHGLIQGSLSACYDSFASYVGRQPPAVSMATTDHAGQTADPRAWTWEARVEKAHCSLHIGQPDGLYWRSEGRRRMVEARLEDRYEVSESENLIKAQAVISAHSTVSSSGDHRSELRSALVEREAVGG